MALWEFKCSATSRFSPPRESGEKFQHKSSQCLDNNGVMRDIFQAKQRKLMSKVCVTATSRLSGQPGLVSSRQR